MKADGMTDAEIAAEFAAYRAAHPEYPGRLTLPMLEPRKNRMKAKRMIQAAQTLADPVGLESHEYRWTKPIGRELPFPSGQRLLARIVDRFRDRDIPVLGTVEFDDEHHAFTIYVEHLRYVVNDAERQWMEHMLRHYVTAEGYLVRWVHDLAVAVEATHCASCGRTFR